MTSATMTSKGQITIPVKVRKALGLKPGIRVDFYEVEEGEYSIRPRSGSIMEMEGCIPKPDHPISIEEMNRAVVARAARLDYVTRSDASGDVPEGEAE